MTIPTGPARRADAPPATFGAAMSLTPGRVRRPTSSWRIVGDLPHLGDHHVAHFDGATRPTVGGLLIVTAATGELAIGAIVEVDGLQKLANNLAGFLAIVTG